MRSVLDVLNWLKCNGLMNFVKDFEGITKLDDHFNCKILLCIDLQLDGEAAGLLGQSSLEELTNMFPDARIPDLKKLQRALTRDLTVINNNYNYNYLLYLSV